MINHYRAMDINTRNKAQQTSTPQYLAALLILLASVFFNTAQAGGKAPTNEVIANNKTVATTTVTTTSTHQNQEPLEITQTPSEKNASSTKLPFALTPYQAEFKVSNGSISTTLNRQLKKSGSSTPQQWTVDNNATLLMIDIEEHAEFHIESDQVVPLNYQYDNDIQSKRNSNLSFNWENKTITDPKQLKEPITLHSELWDKISFQEQLRLDLLNDETFVSKTYDIVDTNRIKSYIVEKLGEEIVSTPAGTFNAIKLKQSRADKEEHTLIWLAKDWQNVILRIDRIDDEETTYQLLFEKGSINNNKITAMKG